MIPWLKPTPLSTRCENQVSIETPYVRLSVIMPTSTEAQMPTSILTWRRPQLSNSSSLIETWRSLLG